MYNFLRTIRTCITSKTGVLTAAGVVLALTMLLAGCPRTTSIDADLAPPSARPANLAAESGNAQVILTWDTVNGATQYRVYRTDSSDGDLTPVTTVTERTFVDSDVTNGTTYRYIVRAANSIGEGPDSEVIATPMAIAPPIPKGFMAIPGDRVVTLSWDRAVGATGYLVYRDGDQIVNISSTTATLPATTYIDTGLTNDTEYSYTVRAYNMVGEGEQSSAVTATPVAATAAPSAPANLSATAGDAQVSLSWDTVPDVTEYRVYRTDDTNPTAALITTITGDTTTPPETTYIDTGLTNGTAYSYTVRAFNSIGESPDSLAATATPAPAQTVPPAPENLTATPANAQITLLWDTVTNAAEYRVYRASTPDGTLARIADGITITETNYIDTDVTNGTQYRYSVSAVNSAGESINNSEVSATPIAPTVAPAAPGNLTVTVGDQSLTLRWNAAAGATEYYVYRGLSTGSLTRIAMDETISELTYTDSGLTNGTEYWYAVSGFNSFGAGSESTEVSATPASAPPAPATLTAIAGNAQVTLSWSMVADASGYRVYRAEGTFGGTLTRIHEIANSNTIMYTNTGLTNGTTYRYTVRAFNDVGESPNSSEVSATPTAAVTLPAAPTNLSAAAGDAQVTLSWNRVTGADEYRVYRAATLSGTLTRIAASTTITDPTYTDTGLTNGTTYRYTVRAFNTAGESPDSDEASATPAAPVTLPVAPMGLSAMASGVENVFQVVLTWEAVDGATEYRIFRADSDSATLTRIAAGTSITTNSYTDADVTANTAYRYTVRAVDSNGESADSAEATATTPALPAAPANLSATASRVAGVFQVALTWDAVTGTGTTTYSIYRANITDDIDSARIIMNVAATSYTDTGTTDTRLAASTTYDYIVVANDSVGSSTDSNTATAITPALLAAPANLTATGGNAQISLSWDAVTGATEYQIYRAATADGELTRIDSNTMITARSYTDTDVTPGTTYRYTVRAVDVIGESADSTEASATTLPVAPANLTAGTGALSVLLAWDAVPGAAEYRIYRAATANGDLTRIASNMMITDTAYTDPGLTNGTTYRYIVRAVNSMMGESADSNEVSAAPDDHGNVLAGATPATSGTGVRGNIEVTGDVDYFSIVVSGASDAAPVTIDATAPGVNTDGILYNESGTQIGRDERNGRVNTEFRIVRQLTENGTYYIRVHGGDDNMGNPTTGIYNLTVIVRSTIIDSDDHRNTRAGATSVTSGTTVSGTLMPAGDYDYFSIAVTGASTSSPMTLTAETTGTLDTFGILFDSDGIELALDDDGASTNSNFRIVYSIMENGTYYIRVGGYRHARTGSYSLGVTLAP